MHEGTFWSHMRCRFCNETVVAVHTFVVASALHHRSDNPNVMKIHEDIQKERRQIAELKK